MFTRYPSATLLVIALLLAVAGFLAVSTTFA